MKLGARSLGTRRHPESTQGWGQPRLKAPRSRTHREALRREEVRARLGAAERQRAVGSRKLRRYLSLGRTRDGAGSGSGFAGSGVTAGACTQDAERALREPAREQPFGHGGGAGIARRGRRHEPGPARNGGGKQNTGGK